MSVSAVVVVLVVAVVGGLARAQFQFCGSRLAEALQTVCQGRGFHRHAVKRIGTDQAAMWGEGDQEFLPGRRVRRSIVEECCRHSCSYQKLESYCAGTASVNPTWLPETLLTNAEEEQESADDSDERNPSRQRYSDAWKNKPFFFVTPSRRAVDRWYTRHPLK